MFLWPAKHITQRTSFQASAWLSNGRIPGILGAPSSVSLPSSHLETLLARNCGMVEGHAPNLNHQAAFKAFIGQNKKSPKFYFHQKHGKDVKVSWASISKMTKKPRNSPVECWPSNIKQTWVLMTTGIWTTSISHKRWLELNLKSRNHLKHSQ